MDVFSLLKIWRNAGVGDPINAGDFDITDDEGSFFDLVFTNPDCTDHAPTVNVISGFHSDHYQQFSKLDGVDLKSNRNYSSPRTVFSNNKRKILPLDSSNTKPPRSPFRVLMLGFHNHKPKLDKKEMKCEIEEVTISSLLKRDNSLRHKFRSEKLLDHDHDQMPSKRFSKDVVHKYLNLIKPFYIKVSKRSNEKVRLPEHSTFTSSSPATASIFSPRKEEKPLGKTVLKEVRKHLGKSRSSSSSSAAVKPIPSPPIRRDDSALQHCSNRMESKAPFYTARNHTIHLPKGAMYYQDLEVLHLKALGSPLMRRKGVASEEKWREYIHVFSLVLLYTGSIIKLLNV